MVKVVFMFIKKVIWFFTLNILILKIKNIFFFSLQVLELIKTRLSLSPNILDRGNRNNSRKYTYSLTISSKKDILAIRSLCENPLFLENKKYIFYFHYKLEGKKLVQYNNWQVNT